MRVEGLELRVEGLELQDVGLSSYLGVPHGGQAFLRLGVWDLARTCNVWGIQLRNEGSHDISRKDNFGTWSRIVR